MIKPQNYLKFNQMKKIINIKIQDIIITQFIK